MRRAVLLHMFVVVAVAASPVSAQDRGFVRALVGATVGAGPGAVFSGTVGVNASDKVLVLGEFGRMLNVMPHSVADQVDVAAAIVANSLGGKHSSTAKAKASYGLAGVRYNLGRFADSQVFSEVGAGAANVKSDVTAVIRGSETLQGDISNFVTTPFTSSTPETKPLMMIGLGAVLGVTNRSAVEFGYRYIRVFTKNPGINASKVYGGFRFGF